MSEFYFPPINKNKADTTYYGNIALFLYRQIAFIYIFKLRV